MTDERLDAAKGLMHMTYGLYNGGAEGTGINIYVNFCHHLFGPKVPQALVDYNVAMQNNIFGGYPDSKDLVPSAIFAAVFGVIGILHLILFIINTSRGHYFWLTLVWVIYSVMKVIGFILRVVWSKDVTQILIGLTSEFFLIVPFVIIVSFNLILTQRLFTWRHPVGGSRWLFWNFMFVLYGFVLIIIAITVLASYVPYLNTISQRSYDSWKKTVAATSILIITYSLTSIALLGLSYFFKPTTKDENLYTYQPWWIESFSPFYFVKKNAAREAEETFMKRNHNHRHAIRVIAATHHHFNVVEGLTNERGSLKHNVSMLIITISTLLIFVGVILRSIVCFQGRYNYQASPVCNPVAMYICWGLFEVIIHAMYLIGRIDLRFYRPDILPQKVRDIITAEQSYYPSDNEYDDLDNDSKYPPYPHSDAGYDQNDSAEKLSMESGSSELDFTATNKFDFKPRAEDDYNHPLLEFQQPSKAFQEPLQRPQDIKIVKVLPDTFNLPPSTRERFIMSHNEPNTVQESERPYPLNFEMRSDTTDFKADTNHLEAPSNAAAALSNAGEEEEVLEEDSEFAF
ncbi:uncharacterized protein PRCAT00003819001 [Priceomyces carsonii]|uniref:uncharacterized protein n=1 Tax=Priceomyces carsonii TaxID=28549 RepID=UPI002EDA319F|nr:unnamed protein product [Priceomyces carsonii]